MANRISQEAVEVLLSASATRARLSQEPVEALESASAAQARVTQEAIEVVEQGPTSARVTQEAVEVVLTEPSQARVTQEAIEALVNVPTGFSRVTQLAVEVLTDPPKVRLPFIASATAVYAPTLVGIAALPFIGSVTVVYPPTLVGAEVDVPFIASNTHAWGIMSLFGDEEGVGPGNGGENFPVELAPNGVTVTATLATNLGAAAALLQLSGDSGLPSSASFMVTIDDEVLYVQRITPGSYRIRGRGMSNTTAASHTAGTDVDWTDSYDMGIAVTLAIAASFIADIDGTGLTTYPGWLVCFDSTQAYLMPDRYPFHVAQVMGVFAPGAGTSGTNKTDGAQPNAICTPPAVSDDCPAALSNPARISLDLDVGDIAVVRYTNPEGSVLRLGPRSAALQSWFGLKRVSTSDVDVTFTDPNGIVVDTTGTYDTFTGSVNDEWGDPIPLQTGISKDASEAAGFAVPTPQPVPWTTVTLLGSNRYFTRGSSHGGYNETGWPMACLAVRQGKRRVPFWQSWDWHDYAYVYAGFGVDCTYAQILINRNGIVFGSVPVVELPGNQDIPGPEAYWDDADYFVGASWYVIIFNTPYLVNGPSIGGGSPTLGPGGPVGFSPAVSFGTGPFAGAAVITIPTIEGGSGGGISPPGRSGLHVWQTS